MKAFSCGALAIVCLLIIGKTQAEFVRVGLKTYYIERDLYLNWGDAWNYCEVNNMQLFSIETDLEKRLLEPILRDNYYWTSGNELAHPSPNVENRNFVWGNLGLPITYTNWEEGDPNNLDGMEHCIQTALDTQWNDRDCEVPSNFVCETSILLK